MKKIIMMLTLILGLSVSVNAQTALVDNGTAKDNWYVGGGVGTNVWNDATSWTLFNTNSKVNDGTTNSWWRTQPLHVNVLVGKMFNPYVGIEVDYNMAFNLRGEDSFLDAHNLTGNAVVNLTNVFGGYQGKRRMFEVELLGGIGWVHKYGENTIDPNVMSVRGALRGNINVAKNWAVTITPEYIWMPKNVASAVTDKHGVNLSVGVKYRIPTKRGNFQLHKLYDQEEVDALNATVATLTKQNSDLSKANADLAETIKKLTSTGSKVVFKTNTKSVGTVLFEKGKSDVTETDVARVVKVLNETNGTIVLTGTTSPEGSEEVNKALGTDRAVAVKKALVASGVDESRIVIKDGYEDRRSVVITLE